MISQRQEERAKVANLEGQLEVLKALQMASPDEVEEEVAVDVYDVDEAELKYADLLLEGSTSEAASLRKEINAEIKKGAAQAVDTLKQEIREDTEKQFEKREQEASIEKLLTKTEKEYPFFDPESDDYNAKAVAVTNSLMSTYVQAGSSKVEALAKAIEDSVELFQPKVPTKHKKGSRPKIGAKQRAQEARTRQPVETPGRRRPLKSDPDTIDMNNMTRDKFRKISAKERSILRGD